MAPTPRPQEVCAFPDCTAVGCYGFREPGIENLPHRRPDAAEVWMCAGHREHGEQLLAAKVAARAAARPSFDELQAKARRAEGLLL